MEIFEVEPSEYGKVISNPYHEFGSASFNDLNTNKCEKIFYLLFKEKKFRLGIIGGIRNKCFHSPFSAPFGGYTYIAESIRIQYIEEAIQTLKTWAAKKKLSSIMITTPPILYNYSFIAKQLNCLWREGFEIANIDLNFSFNLKFLDQEYQEYIWYNARKNLKIAITSELKFIKCMTDKEKMLAYEIIDKNRENRGYPLRMTWQEVSDTIRIIPADVFIINDKFETPIASALVFHVSKETVQVIYWGDIPGFSEIKPMNYLAYKVFEYYKSINKKNVDVGPSTENSIPNYGLCEFKESIGCFITPKYTLIKKL